jgi:hypothetical protein
MASSQSHNEVARDDGAIIGQCVTWRGSARRGEGEGEGGARACSETKVLVGSDAQFATIERAIDTPVPCPMRARGGGGGGGSFSVAP